MGTPENAGPRGGGGGTGSGGAGARGAVLLAVALVLGIVLLQKFDETDGAGTSVGVNAGPSATTSTTRRATVSVVPPTTSRAARAPDQVKVLVANGTGISGLAGRVTDLLKGANYNALSPVDATKLSEVTLVEYKPDFEPEARVVAQLLMLPGSALRPMEDSPPVLDTRGADVIVIAGPDLKLPGDTAATTSTTIRR